MGGRDARGGRRCRLPSATGTRRTSPRSLAAEIKRRSGIETRVLGAHLRPALGRAGRRRHDGRDHVRERRDGPHRRWRERSHDGHPRRQVRPRSRCPTRRSAPGPWTSTRCTTPSGTGRATPACWVTRCCWVSRWVPRPADGGSTPPVGRRPDGPTRPVLVRALRRRVARGRLLVVVMTLTAEPFEPDGYGPGQDARAYWAAPLDDPYTPGSVGQESAYLYSPAFLQVARHRCGSCRGPCSWPAGPCCCWRVLRWLSGPLLFGPLIVLTFPELWGGNITILLAAMIVVGFRRPGVWAFALLTKVTPALGLAVVRGPTGVARAGRGRLPSRAVIVAVSCAPGARACGRTGSTCCGRARAPARCPARCPSRSLAPGCRSRAVVIAWAALRRSALAAAHRRAARDARHLVGQLRTARRERGPSSATTSRRRLGSAAGERAPGCGDPG